MRHRIGRQTVKKTTSWQGSTDRWIRHKVVAVVSRGGGAERPCGCAVRRLLPVSFVSGLLVQGLPPPAASPTDSASRWRPITFANGRLTNPTHPLWRHFESPHILQVPTYCSKYPPGQGLVPGAWPASVFGHPAFGIWLSVPFAAAAVCWMLMTLVGGIGSTRPGGGTSGSSWQKAFHTIQAALLSLPG